VAEGESPRRPNLRNKPGGVGGTCWRVIREPRAITLKDDFRQAAHWEGLHAGLSTGHWRRQRRRRKLRVWKESTSLFELRIVHGGTIEKKSMDWAFRRRHKELLRDERPSRGGSLSERRTGAILVLTGESGARELPLH